MSQNNVWVVIPAYNEAKNIASVLKKAKKLPYNLLVIDDGSKDNTLDLVKKQNVRVISHIVNLGKGAALKTGCDYAFVHGATDIVVLDGDGQHDPAQVPDFLKQLENNDIVLGARKFDKEMPPIQKLGNVFLNKVTEVLYRISISDTQSGFRAFTAQAYRKIRWSATDYAMETEMVAKAGRERLKYKEIPIPTIYKDRYKGTTVIDGIKIFAQMVMWRLKWF